MGGKKKDRKAKKKASPVGEEGGCLPGEGRDLELPELDGIHNWHAGGRTGSVKPLHPGGWFALRCQEKGNVGVTGEKKPILHCPADGSGK